MSDRGMKKWAPYKSLVEHSEMVDGFKNSGEPVQKPVISNEEAEIINEILTNYSGETLLAKYYRNHQIKEESIVIKQIDTINKKLILKDRKVIHFKELFSLKKVD